MNQNKKGQRTDLQQTPLSEILAHIADSAQPISNAELGELSDLNAEEARQFEETWALLDIERKRQILLRLEELTEDNVELNFDRIYRNAIYDIDDTVRREAVEGLWESNDPSILHPLLRMVQQDAASEVRSAAATALGRFAMLAEHKKISEENRKRISQILLEIIHNSKEPVEIRRRALEAVSPLSMPEVTQTIWEAYRRDEQGLRISSVYAMGRNCDMLWMPTVLTEMNSEDPEMRYEAATAAGELGESEAIPRLIELTIDPDIEVTLAAIMALGKIGGQEAKQRLRTLITDKSKAIHDAAEQAISEIEAYEEPPDPRINDFDEPDTD